MNNTNYNMAVCGTSGAGKTGLIQPLIRSVLDSGGFAVVFDMGDGYKSLCENMGGVYLDGETLRFNPFANITDIDQSAERVRDQLSVMASPNGNLDEVHEGLLLQAVRASWLAKKNKARIDDVVDFLKNARDNDQYVESPTTVKETTADGMLAAAFVILYSGVLLFILYFCFSALTDLQKPDERKSDERNEDE